MLHARVLSSLTLSSLPLSSSLTPLSSLPSSSLSSRSLSHLPRSSLPPVRESSFRLSPSLCLTAPLRSHRALSTSPFLSSQVLDPFIPRHIGTKDSEQEKLLKTIGVGTVEELLSKAIPQDIRYATPPQIGSPRGESELLQELRVLSQQNQVFKNFIGTGYYDTLTPNVLLRNVLENPQWYTPYTPYQPEIAQGRLESLLNYQTVISDLTALPVANASLLDEGTAAAEAAVMCIHRKTNVVDIFISSLCHPQTIAIVKTRLEALGSKVHVGDHETFDFEKTPVAGAIVQYPATNGTIFSYQELKGKLAKSGSLLVVGSDLLALTLLTPPGEWGADICFGSSQRFGVPLGGGGPHAAFLSCTKDLMRTMPGRLIGLSQDARGQPALRMTLQTREQHIKRERATSNICTAQALLANLASFYAVYHGPDGLKEIARRVHHLACVFEQGVKELGFIYNANGKEFFDTLTIDCGSADVAEKVIFNAEKRRMNLRRYSSNEVSVSFDEPTTLSHVNELLASFAEAKGVQLVPNAEKISSKISSSTFSDQFNRKSEFMTHPVFHTYHSETDMMRYLHSLASKDYGLQHGMIPLGSCTMKLNAAVEMLPIVWKEFGAIHPFAPKSQTRGYQQLFHDLETMLSAITGFAGCSLQPNAGSQGELAGLLIIKKYHESRGEPQRKLCLIPVSAHGTNPASVICAGMDVQTVACDESGNVCIDDLQKKAKEAGDRLAALVVTYPSTHGVFEESIRHICQVIHDHGGQVYMDGANMNAQCLLTSPGFIGADVCHLNLHKTFCIPHGGGGPGMGPIGVASHLVPFLPTHPLVSPVADDKLSIGTVSAAGYGSASILPISWVYIKLMGTEGIRRASSTAILHANYMAARIKEHFPILYTNKNGVVGHEFIVDLRHFKKSAGIEAIDVAKRLQDYGFHAPTLAFPVPGTLMIEPTESEGLNEMNRFIDAMISIRAEIREIEEGKADKEVNVLKLAPHVIQECTSDKWDRPYSREKAAFPLPSLRYNKFWPTVKRLNDVYGDRNVVSLRSVGDLVKKE